MYLPFYDSRDVSSPEAELDAMKFVLWLSFVAERAGHILNPTDTSIAEMAGTLLNHWNSKKHAISRDVSTMPTRNLYFASYSLIICKLQDIGCLLALHSPYRQANETKDRISHFGRRCKITNKTSSSQLFPSPCPERNGAKGKKRRAAGKTVGKNSVDIL